LNGGAGCFLITKKFNRDCKENIMSRDKWFFIVQPLLKSMPYKTGRYLRNKIYPFFFKKVGKNVNFCDGLIIKYPSEIEVGDNVTFNQNCFLVGKGGLVFGNDIMMGAGCKVVTTSHNADSKDIPMRDQGMCFEKIIIGNDVWFGFNVIVLKGCEVGNGVILGAGCVLTTKHVEDYTIWGGVPAKNIGSRK
jgi:maltose O-acetyltransferase